MVSETEFNTLEVAACGEEGESGIGQKEKLSNNAGSAASATSATESCGAEVG